MRVIFDGVHDIALRVHPWDVSKHQTPGRYYNLTEQPELIRTSLEDFLPYNTYEGVQDFYCLLDSLNTPSCPLDTNDSRLLDHMLLNPRQDLAKGNFASTVLLGFLFRDLRLNLADDSPKWYVLWESNEIEINEFRILPNSKQMAFVENFLKIVQRSTGNTWPQIINIGFMPTHYDQAPVLPTQRYGLQFVLRAWLAGNGEQEIFDGLSNVVSVLRIALEKSVPS